MLTGGSSPRDPPARMNDRRSSTTRNRAIMPSESAGSGLIVYLDTDDIDASVAKVRELGGSAEDKQPVPTHGWFASCKDTEGNSFSLWQADPNAA